MNSIIRDPFFQRMFMSAGALVCLIVAVKYPTIAGYALGLSGTLVGWAHGTKPGDIPIAALPTAVQQSIKPPPKMFPDDIPIAYVDDEPPSQKGKRP